VAHFPVVAIGSVINERWIVVNRIHIVYTRAKAPKRAGRLIWATTMPTEKFDADATHGSNILVARDAAQPRKPHDGPNRVADVPSLYGHAGVRHSLARMRAT
jgi:hypothetical protein